MYLGDGGFFYKNLHWIAFFAVITALCVTAGEGNRMSLFGIRCLHGML